MANKMSLIGQIAEIDREIRMRERVYPQQVNAGKMRKEEAEMLMERIHAVLASLQFLKKNEADIRALIDQKRSKTTGGQA